MRNNYNHDNFATSLMKGIDNRSGRPVTEYELYDSVQPLIENLNHIVVDRDRLTEVRKANAWETDIHLTLVHLVDVGWVIPFYPGYILTEEGYHALREFKSLNAAMTKIRREQKEARQIARTRKLYEVYTGL